jgi:hypothetical protein
LVFVRSGYEDKFREPVHEFAKRSKLVLTHGEKFVTAEFDRRRFYEKTFVSQTDGVFSDATDTVF